MRRLEPVELTSKQLIAELAELERFLNENELLKERDQVLPFFQSRSQLVTALGWMNAGVRRPGRYAFELDLFGDLSCDAAARDLGTGAFTLIEFEDARQDSVFRPLEHGKSVRKWSPRFEHGFSQLVDWAWRLDTEGFSEATQRIFDSQPISLRLLLVIGRTSDLADRDFRRMTWRSQSVRLGRYSMSCLTFDDVLLMLRGRIVTAEAAAAEGTSR